MSFLRTVTFLPAIRRAGEYFFFRRLLSDPTYKRSLFVRTEYDRRVSGERVAVKTYIYMDVQYRLGHVYDQRHASP